jgi:hypothetical protein
MSRIKITSMRPTYTDRPAGTPSACSDHRQANLSASSWSLVATAEQKKQKQNRNRYSEEPEQNIPCRPYLLDSLFEFHID